MAKAHDEAAHDAAHGYHMGTGDETGRTRLSGPGFTDLPIEYVVTPEGICLWGGCIDIGTKEEVEAARDHHDTVRAATQTPDMPADDGGFEARGVGLPPSSDFLWPNMVVPFTIAADVPNQGRIDDAIAHIHANTGIRMVRRTSQDDYVEIISNGNAGWSSSAIGRRGGRQFIRYADGHPWPIFVHELFHACGVHHEQCRSDRDTFVEIRFDNIQEDAVGNFQKQPGSVDYFDYDYGSLMHYPRTSFAIDSSKPTIVPKQSGVTIGQRQRLSWGDRQTIAKMYERFRTTGFAGVWRAGNDAHGLWANASWESFRDKWQQWSNQGLRLSDIHVRTAGNSVQYTGVFRAGSGAHGLWANVDWESFRSKWQEWSGQGLRLVDLNIRRNGGQSRFSGVFQQGSGGHGIWVDADWDSFRSKWQEWSAQGLRLVDMDVSRVGNQTRYSGVFLAGSGGHAMWANATWESFVAKWQELSAQGLRLVDINLHRDANGALRYSGCFLPGTDAHYLWANVTWESFRAKWEELNERGLRLVDFEMTIPSAAMGDVADASLFDGSDTMAELIEPYGGLFDLPAAARAPEAGPEDHGGLMTGDEAAAIPAAGEGLAQLAPVANGAHRPASSEDPRGDGEAYGAAVH